MISSSTGYQTAIVADRRKILVRAVIDISDPDLTFGVVTADSEAPYSKSAELHDKIFERGPVYATLERNRWLLNGEFRVLPDNYHVDTQVGYVGNLLSGDDGAFAGEAWVQLAFSNVSVLQACSVFFPDSTVDGVADTFTVEVLQGGTAYFTETVTANREDSVSFTGFTVYNPDAIKVTVKRWSLPGRRVRLMEIIPGVYERWDNHMLASFQVVQQANFSALSLPYGTCTLRMDNLDRRFEPRSKEGIFQSIEERQGIDVSIGVQLADGQEELKPVGKFYQFSGGWKTGDNGISMQWNLVDIIGLLADREYILPDTLPSTLEGWAASFVAQLGPNFEGLYTVDPGYKDIQLNATAAEVTGKTCGELLRWVCMATGTWPRADAETGSLAVEPFWNQGGKLDLDNITAYPVMKANDDLGAIIFTLNDGNGTQYIVSGTSVSSNRTESVSNPFIHTEAEALAAARMILATYGGNKLETTGRGDPSGEIGDVDTVWLNESTATTGRRMYQTFQFQNGVMQGCQSTLLQADGSFMFEGREIITQSGTWKAPAGVTQLRVIIGQGGQGSGCGEGGVMTTAGSSAKQPASGENGSGGKVWFATIPINPAQEFAVSIGAGGAAAASGTAPGAEGGESTFGVYSSADGELYPLGFTDVASGDSFGRTGVASPLDGSGDGAKGGAAGRNGIRVRVEKKKEDGTTSVSYKTKSQPTPGSPGKAGAGGFVVVYWDKNEVTV